MTPADRYTRLAITLHWLMAVLIIGNIVLIKIVDQLPEERIRLAIDTHKSVGITVLGLFVLRVLWRLAHRPPQLPQDMPDWERRGAHLAHVALYGLLFALPFSGWLHDSAWRAAAEHPMHLFGGVEWPRIAWVMEQEPVFKERLHHWFGMAHEWLADVFYVLLALHVLGALKHQFLDRKKQLQRMWY